MKRSLHCLDDISVEEPLFDDRVLGLGDFVRKLGLEKRDRILDRNREAKRIISLVCKEFSVSVAELLGKSKRIQISMARARAAQELQERLGMSISEISRQLFVTRRAVSNMIEKNQLDNDKYR